MTEISVPTGTHRRNDGNRECTNGHGAYQRALIVWLTEMKMYQQARVVPTGTHRRDDGMVSKT